MILCGSERGPARALVGEGVVVEELRPPIDRSATSRLRLVRPMAERLAARPPDILFAPGNFHLPVIAGIARRLGPDRPATVVKISNPLVPAAGLTRAPAVAMVRRMARMVDAFVAMSPALRDEAAAVIPGARIEVIAEPTFDQVPGADARDLPVGRDILCIGRLEPQKNFALAIRAFAELPPLDGASLIILGEGAERRALVSLAERLGVGERVVFPGHVADITPWLERARIMLMTSRFEGYPAVAAEARGAGIPMVTTRSSVAMADILPTAAHGTIVDSAEPAALASAMATLYGRPRASRAALAAGLDQLSLDAAAPAWLALFDDVMR